VCVHARVRPHLVGRLPSNIVSPNLVCQLPSKITTTTTPSRFLLLLFQTRGAIEEGRDFDDEHDILFHYSRGMQVGSFEFVFGLKHNLTARALKQGAVCLALARDAFQEIAKMHPADMGKVFRNGMKEQKVKGAATMKSRVSTASRGSRSSRGSRGSRNSKTSASSRKSNASRASKSSKNNCVGNKDTHGKGESNEVHCVAAVLCSMCGIRMYSWLLSANTYVLTTRIGAYTCTQTLCA
jgi:hypothetical protein